MDTLPDRKTIRLKGFDYSRGGGYFVTICCRHGQHRFGEIVPIDGDTAANEITAPTWRVEYNEFGRIVIDELEQMERRFPGTTMAGHMVMPNHVHFMLINDDTSRHTLSEIVRRFKMGVSRRCIQQCNEGGGWMNPLWQRSFYEHVVRSNGECRNMLRYMYENPMRWAVKHDTAPTT